MDGKKTKILLCEDDQNLGMVLKNYLELNDFDVTLERDGRLGLAAFQREKFDICLLDIKGDLSGIAAPGTLSDKITERLSHTGGEFKPAGMPVEFLTISNEQGVRIRATVTEFGPVLLSKILGLNSTQEGVVALIFKYCDDRHLPLLNLKDFIKLLQYIGDEGKKEIEKEYGKISTTTTGTILRKVIELQQQGADVFLANHLLKWMI